MARNKQEKVTPIIIDGFEINAPNVTFQKLQEFSLTLYEKLLNQRRERNYLLLERDKLRTILENTRHEIKVANDIALNKEAELEKTRETHLQELKEVDQEVKYVMYDHKIDLAELMAWENKILTLTEERNLVEEMKLLQEKRELKEEIVQKERQQEQKLMELKNKNQDEVVQLQDECEKVKIQREIEFRRSINSLVEQMTLKHEMEMSEIEERKNAHLVELKSIHKTRLEEMKFFFNSITAEHLTVIANLKQSLDSLKKNKVTMANEVKILKRENEKIKEPLTKSKAEVKNLTRQLVNYEKDLLSLKHNKSILTKTVEDIRKIKKKSSLAVRKIKNNESTDLTEHLKASCICAMVSFKTDAARKKQQLEESIENLLRDLKEKYQILKELTFDPDVKRAITELNFEFWNPRNITHEMALVCKAYDDLLDTLDKKLREFCIPEEEVLKSTKLNMDYTGAAPAALVSNQ